MYYTMFRTCPIGADCRRVPRHKMQDCSNTSRQICSEVKDSPELMSLPSGDVHWQVNQTFTDAHGKGRVPFFQFSTLRVEEGAAGQADMIRA